MVSREKLVELACECDKEQKFEGVFLPNAEMCNCTKQLCNFAPLTANERTLFHALKRAQTDICAEVLDLIDKYLLPAHTDPEGAIFFLKMKGDYHRYYAEVSPTQAEKDCSLTAYTTAGRYAAQHLPVTHPLRLNVALNHSVFEYDNGNVQRALEICKGAFDDAHPQLNNLQEAAFKETVFVMELLRENICMWAKEIGVDLGGEGGQQ